MYERDPFFKNAQIIISLIEKKIIHGYIPSLIFRNIYYILSGYPGEKDARKKLKSFRSLINIIAVDGNIIDIGLNSGIKDFEDPVQYYTARSGGMYYLITRNIKDYLKSGLSILKPEEFIHIIRDQD